MDIFEWAHGFSKRMNLINMDYETIARIPIRTAYWYKDVISKNQV